MYTNKLILEPLLSNVIRYKGKINPTCSNCIMMKMCGIPIPLNHSNCLFMYFYRHSQQVLFIIVAYFIS